VKSVSIFVVLLVAIMVGFAVFLQIRTGAIPMMAWALLFGVTGVPAIGAAFLTPTDVFSRRNDTTDEPIESVAPSRNYSPPDPNLALIAQLEAEHQETARKLAQLRAGSLKKDQP
jgi:hypothetical protein